MQIPAASLGEAVPRENFDATIQSVFESAVNLRLEGEDRLITLLVSDRYELPQGIRITDKTIPLQSLTVGLRAASRGGILRFDSSPLTIDLRSASLWKCRMKELNAVMQSSQALEAWSLAWKLLNKNQKLKNADLVAEDLIQADSGSPLSRRMARPVSQLATAADRYDVEGTIHAAERMIGLGPGVTPSGDDVLIGFLAALWSMAGKHKQQLSYIHAFGAALMQIAKQTNEISRTYLFHATQGQFSSTLTHLAEAIVTGGDVQQHLQSAMRVGHSSGMDSVTGMLIGLRIWNTEHSYTDKAFTDAEKSIEETL